MITEEDIHDQVGNSGQPHWGVEIMIAGDEGASSKTPRQADIDTPGEILIRSPSLMTAYLLFNYLQPASEPDISATLEALTTDG